MNVIITGATGFIGRHLFRSLQSSGHIPIAITRDVSNAKGILGEYIPTYASIPEALSRYKVDAIINLAGENISSGRWSEEKKKEILESRTRSGRSVIEAIRSSKIRPCVLIQASAIGIYGGGFLSEVVKKWEDSVKDAGSFGVRLVTIRSAPVLGMDGGILPDIIKPFKYFVGGILGSGKEWFSWIHIDDEISAIKFLLENGSAKGTFDLTSPEPVESRVFYMTLSRRLKRPCFFRIPKALIGLIFGEKGKDLLLSSIKVVPTALNGLGFKFNFSTLDKALCSLIKEE